MKNWQIKTLKQLYVPINNLSYSRDFLTETPQRLAYIHYGDIHTDKIPEVVSAKTTMSFLLDSISIPSEEKYLLKEGDIVLVDASEDYEGVGKNIEISAIQNKKIVSGLHTIALRPIDATNLTPGFGRYLLKHPLVSKRLKAIAQGTKVFSISFTLIQKLKVPFPPLEEQRKIVEVLETWDKAITLTKQLIEQKELQKKYLMQQLLTGRTRLKGFTDMWQETKLGSLLEEKSKRNKKLRITRVLSVTNTRGFILPKEQFARNVASADLSNYKIVQKGDFAYNPSRINVGSISFLDSFENGILSPMYVVFSCSAKLSYFYFKHWIKTGEFISKVSHAAQGSVRSTVDFSSLSTIKIKYPTSLFEQQAIAEVFSSANKEIYLLKQKLAKLEEQKKGLMQALLTGKVRLK